MKTQKEAMAALTKLFLIFPQANGNETEKTARFAAYWQVLQTREPAFVVEACEYASKGKLGNGTFLPSAAELYQCAEAFAARASKQHQRLHLSEPEVRNDPQTRARIISGFKKLLADLRAGVPIDPDKATKAVFHPELPDYRATPPSVSTSLQQKLAEIAAENEL